MELSAAIKICSIKIKWDGSWIVDKNIEPIWYYNAGAHRGNFAIAKRITTDELDDINFYGARAMRLTSSGDGKLTTSVTILVGYSTIEERNSLIDRLEKEGWLRLKQR